MTPEQINQEQQEVGIVQRNLPGTELILEKWFKEESEKALANYREWIQHFMLPGSTDLAMVNTIRANYYVSCWMTLFLGDVVLSTNEQVAHEVKQMLIHTLVVSGLPEKEEIRQVLNRPKPPEGWQRKRHDVN